MNEQVWILDDDSAIRWVLERAMAAASLSYRSFSDGHSLLAALEQTLAEPAESKQTGLKQTEPKQAGLKQTQPKQAPPQVVVSDIRMPGLDGLTVLSRIHQLVPHLPVIIMTAHSDLDSAVQAYQQGAFEYLPKPFDIDKALTLVAKAIAHRQSPPLLATPSKVSTPLTATAGTTSATTPDTGLSLPAASTPQMIGEAPAMQAVFRAIGRLARSSIAVLINGQSGTGKELVAKALHKHSPRAQRPFIALNMAAIPKDLIESELFGHEKGAFTGANNVRQGRFEQAHGGTLFLDEIGDMPLEVQTRLLRVLADGQFYRVGGQAALKVDVRIIAATHQDLELKVAAGNFREDLFHRLNVIRILMPALKDRAQDIPQLARHFLAQAAHELSVEGKFLHSSTEAYLQTLPWPGNVRQLENLCRWLTVMTSAQEVLLGDLPEELQANSQTRSQSANPSTPGSQATDWRLHLQLWAEREFSLGRAGLLTELLPEVEQILIECALQHSQGHKQAAAKLLGWGRNTLTRKLNLSSEE